MKMTEKSGVSQEAMGRKAFTHSQGLFVPALTDAGDFRIDTASLISAKISTDSPHGSYD
jgi:hypothetical protein